MLQQIHTSTKNPFSIMDFAENNPDHLMYKKGQLIYCEGSTPLGAYIVQKGKVKISKIGSDGKEQIMRIATSDEMLSYTDLVLETRYTTFAKALEDTTLLFIPKQQFWSTIRNQHKIFENLMQLLSNDLKQAETKITDLAYKPVRGRLADALISLVKKFNGSKIESVSISITRSDLACFVGTAKETVNRFLSEFRNEELIATDGTKIRILDLKGLQNISCLYN